MISQAAVDLIVASEVTSKAVYQKRYQHPEWPGGRSGVTIAIGYDLGYATPAKVRSDWGGRVPQHMIDLMVRCCGVTGDAARSLCQAVQGIVVPWDTAIAVFNDIDLPQWIERVSHAIPGAERLPPDCLGALVSLAYNRGASFGTDGDRYREMRAIKADVVTGKLNDVAAQFRAMKRLWPDVAGLKARREAEARLFEKGLSAPAAESARPVPKIDPPPLRPDSKPGAAEHGTAGGVVIGGGAVAKQAHDGGLSAGKVTAIVIVFLIIAFAAWCMVREARNAPVTARQKG